MADTAIVVEGSVYRTLVAHRPEVAHRMPLVVDPAPSGRIQPIIAGRQSPEFQALELRYQRVVVFQNLPGTTTRIPDLRDLSASRDVRRASAEPAVFCSYFGDPLAILTTPGGALIPEHAAELAEQIVAVDPEQVRCAAAPRR